MTVVIAVLPLFASSGGPDESGGDMPCTLSEKQAGHKAYRRPKKWPVPNRISTPPVERGACPWRLRNSSKTLNALIQLTAALKRRHTRTLCRASAGSHLA